MKKLLAAAILLLSVVSLTACYPEGTDYIHKRDIALTHHEENVNFGNYKTFVMPDSVLLVQRNGDRVLIENEVQAKMLNLVKKNFADRNYQLLTAVEAEREIPDFMVTLTVFVTPVFSYVSWGDYWKWYPVWNWLGWGNASDGFYPFYPWYGEGGAFDAYEEGTLIIDVLDIKKANKASKRIPVLWSGINSGILAGNRVYWCQHLEKSVNQCFIQSPYLKSFK